MPEDKSYMIIDEGNDIIQQLRDRYPKCFWPVEPSHIVVLGVTNKPRPFSQLKLATITKVDPAHRTIIRSFCSKDIQYIIEVYCEDWKNWNDTLRQWILAHEISHIGLPNMKGLVKHDLEDFSWIIDSAGIGWSERDDLPNLLGKDLFPFKEHLFNRIHTDGEEDTSGSYSSNPEVSFD
jgi:hypothetical protein